MGAINMHSKHADRCAHSEGLAKYERDQKKLDDLQEEFDGKTKPLFDAIEDLKEQYESYAEDYGVDLDFMQWLDSMW
jgi:hypothetical protein